MSEVLLEAKDIKKYFHVTKGLLFLRAMGWIKAVDGVSFSIREGECFGLVGESGCGKTTIAKLFLLLETINSGAIFFQGKDIHGFSRQELRFYRHSVQAVFQDPSSSLNPRMRAVDIIAEPMEVNATIPKRMINERVSELLELVGLNLENATLYPHEFSGGQKQRIAVARALATNPRFIVLDEPVSALDVSIKAQIMNLLNVLKEKFSLTYLLIGHDLAVMQHMSDRIGVMYLGRMVEILDSYELCTHPLHPYTIALLSAVPQAHPDDQTEEVILPGEVPSPLDPPKGCRFHTRCLQAMPICTEIEPVLKEAASDHHVACHLH